MTKNQRKFAITKKFNIYQVDGVLTVQDYQSFLNNHDTVRFIKSVVIITIGLHAIKTYLIDDQYVKKKECKTAEYI